MTYSTFIILVVRSLLRNALLVFIKCAKMLAWNFKSKYLEVFRMPLEYRMLRQKHLMNIIIIVLAKLYLLHFFVTIFQISIKEN